MQLALSTISWRRLTTEHLAAVKHVLRYIVGPLTHDCTFRGGDNIEPMGKMDKNNPKMKQIQIINSPRRNLQDKPFQIAPNT